VTLPLSRIPYYRRADCLWFSPGGLYNDRIMGVKEMSAVGSKLSGLHRIRITGVRNAGVLIIEELLYCGIPNVFCNGISSSVTRQEIG